MEIEGMIIRDLGMFEGISKAGNPWKKHEWLLETIGTYPRKIKFTVFGDRTNTISFELGKRYAIQVDVESREFNERWYTDLTAYAFRPLDGDNGEGTGQGPQYNSNTAAPQNPYVSTPQFAQPQAPSGNPFKDASAGDFSGMDSQEDLPF